MSRHRVFSNACTLPQETSEDHADAWGPMVWSKAGQRRTQGRCNALIIRTIDAMREPVKGSVQRVDHPRSESGAPLYYAPPRRLCMSVTKSGRACKTWALRNSEAPICAVHAHHAHGPRYWGRVLGGLIKRRRQRAKYAPCRCQSGPAFPHRPASKGCVQRRVSAAEAYRMWSTSSARARAEAVARS
jgi:hypothetical protein